MACFRNRLRFEGRYEEMLAGAPPKPEKAMGNVDYVRACRSHYRKFGYRGYRELFWEIERQLMAFDAMGRAPIRREVEEFNRQSRLIMESAVEALKKTDAKDRPFGEQLLWLFNHWLSAFIDDPENPGEKLPNPIELCKAKSEGIFGLAVWASKNQDEFFRSCIRYLAVVDKAAASAAGPAGRSEDEKIVDTNKAEFDEYLAKHYKDNKISRTK
jgi:hypothetical protein